MNEVTDFFRKLFDSSDWPPRWHCGEWSSFHGWLYIISDLLIWSAYFAIPVVILKFISRRVESRFMRAYLLFAAFILACGSTHLLDAIAFWFPAYRLSALLRFITGVISWITVFYMVRLLPVALQFKSHTELEKEIQERSRAEAEMKVAVVRLNEAQEIAKMGNWEWDIVTNKVSWSDGLFKIYGIPQKPEGLQYEDFIRLVHPDDRSIIDDSIRHAFATNEFPDHIYRILMPDGSVKTLQAKGEAMANADGHIVKMHGTVQDITEQYQAAQQLLHKSKDLEMRNHELQQFAFVASHDLQEPLRKIRTFSSLLGKQSNDLSDEQNRAALEKIVHSAGRMQQLIDDILQFSNISAENLPFEKLSLDDVVQSVLRDLELSVAKTGAAIRVENLPQIEAVRAQMEQLLLNLLRNALKFHQPGKPPVIHITSRGRTGAELAANGNEKAINLLSVRNAYWRHEQYAELCIRDNGIGFDETYATRIFEIFQRLHTRQDYAGNGIGLAICKKIVDNHCGAIWAESKPGQGTAFFILLPVKQGRR